MKKRILLASALSMALLGIVVIRWAVIRWHHQDLMFERLNNLYIYHDLLGSGDAKLESLIDDQWDDIVHYLEHPMMLEPRIPNSFNNIQTRPSFWEHMILPTRIKELQDRREMLSETLNTKYNGYRHESRASDRE